MKIPSQDWIILAVAFVGSLTGFIYNGNPLSFGMAVLSGIAIVIAIEHRFSR